MEKVISKLSNSDNKITDIAYNCGFSNVRSFKRAFKTIFGITPSEYKKIFCQKRPIYIRNNSFIAVANRFRIPQTE